MLECAMRFRKGTMIEKCHAYAKSDKSSNKRKEKSNRYATLLFDGRWTSTPPFTKVFCLFFDIWSASASTIRNVAKSMAHVGRHLPSWCPLISWWFVILGSFSPDNPPKKETLQANCPHGSSETGSPLKRIEQDRPHRSYFWFCWKRLISTTSYRINLRYQRFPISLHSFHATFGFVDTSSVPIA